MAIYGVLGDIHGNLQALESALQALDREGVRDLLCVGDLVGYNAQPDECVALLRGRNAVCIAGNHDLIGTGRLGFDRCSNKAMHALKRTRRRLGPGTAAFLRELPSHSLVEGRILLTHGGVRDVQQYMTRPHHILENAAYLAHDFPGIDVCFFGHTHEQKVFSVAGAHVGERTDSATLEPGRVHFVNPGSVDASRKREHKLAEFAIFDSASSHVEFRQAPYDERRTEAMAAADGYRIDRWRDRLYDVSRRLVGPRQVA